MLVRILGIAAVFFLQGHAYDDGGTVEEATVGAQAYKEEVHNIEEDSDYGGGVHVELEAKERKMLPILAKLQKRYEDLSDTERKKLIDKADLYREKFSHVLGKIDKHTAREFGLKINVLRKILGLEDADVKKDDHLDHYEALREEDGHGSVDYSDEEVKVESVYEAEPAHKQESAYIPEDGHGDDYSQDLVVRKAAPISVEDEYMRPIDHESVLEQEYNEDDRESGDYIDEDGYDSFDGFHNHLREIDSEDFTEYEARHLVGLRKKPFYDEYEDFDHMMYRDQLRLQDMNKRFLSHSARPGKTRQIASRRKNPYEKFNPSMLYEDSFLGVEQMFDDSFQLGGGHFENPFELHHPHHGRGRHGGKRRHGKAAVPKHGLVVPSSKLLHVPVHKHRMTVPRLEMDDLIEYLHMDERHHGRMDERHHGRRHHADRHGPY